MPDPVRGVSPRELQDLYRAAVAEGCTLSQNRKGHLTVVLPNGRRFTGPKTASDNRAVLNARSTLRNLGLRLGRKNP